jgi:hypothetical protein
VFLMSSRVVLLERCSEVGWNLSLFVETLARPFLDRDVV